MNSWGMTPCSNVQKVQKVHHLTSYLACTRSVPVTLLTHSMLMLEKICDDFELSAKGSNPCRQHAHMHSKVSKNGPLFCNQNRVTVWSVWQTCQHILTACCYICLLCGFAHSLFSAGIRAMSVVLMQTQGRSCFQWRFVKGGVIHSVSQSASPYQEQSSSCLRL